MLSRIQIKCFRAILATLEKLVLYLDWRDDFQVHPWEVTRRVNGWQSGREGPGPAVNQARNK